jgi:hypothetical protein
MGMYGKIIAIGIALSSLLMYSSIGICEQPLGLISPEAQHNVLSSANGRFVFGQISDSTTDQFMLDTVTGRLWRATKRTDIGICLMSVPYRTEKGECSPLPEKISDAGDREAKGE